MKKIPRLNLRSRRTQIILAAVIVLLASAVSAFILTRDNKTNDEPIEPTKYYSQLTGEEVEREVSERPILGIMIENSQEARPQTGLDSAGIVFEAVTEGGITRYLALYQEDQPETVGPVRSLRTHFLNWAMGFDASIAHVGGSAEALQLAASREAKSLTQFRYTEPYSRVDFRAPPHNVYASTEALRSLQEQLGYETSEFAEIPRSDASTQQNPQEQTISIDFSRPLYQAQFRYDNETNSYIRYLNGQPHIDAATNQPITVKNVIVMRTPPQASGANVIGKGEAVIFKDGQAIETTWQKANYGARFKIIDSNNNEVPLNRGDSWVAALSTDRTLSY